MSDRKAIKDTIKKIDKYWKQRAKDDPEGVMKLLGEDCYLNIIDEDYTENICYACGKECKPHRAHVIPDCLGGEPEPSNMFLLCVQCHQANPDTIYPDMFYNFVKSTPSHVLTRSNLIWHYLTSLIENSPKEDVAKFMKAIEDGTAKDFQEKFMYVDIHETGPGLNNALSEATLVSVVWKRAIASQSA